MVIAAFKTLCWLRNAYTYHDCLEQYQDWGEMQLSDYGLEEGEIEAIRSELLWIEKNIPKDYRFLLRNKERPDFRIFLNVPRHPHGRIPGGAGRARFLIKVWPGRSRSLIVRMMILSRIPAFSIRVTSCPCSGPQEIL